MYLVVGLGNPGRQYDNSRHNIGFLAVDELADRIGIKLTRQGFSSLYNTGTICGNRVLIMKPQTYMNNSGVAVSQARNFYNIDNEKIIVIHDEMDLPLERIKIKKNGGSAGHNGIKSIIYHLGTDDFPRIRIGVGKPVHKGEGINHVLSSFSDSEKVSIGKILEIVLDAVEKVISKGIVQAMNEINSKSEKNNESN